MTRRGIPKAAGPEIQHDTARKALLAAQAQFVAWRATFGQADARVDRPAFNRLRKAVGELQGALGAFATPDANRAILLGLLQAQRALRPQSEYADALARLDALLGLLRLAAARAGGRQVDELAHVWVWMAAEHWAKRTEKDPAAGENSPFWLELQALQDDESARDRALPLVGRDLATAAIEEWRQRREAMKP